MEETALKPSLPITPETKVGALLDAYPRLETVLIEMAPSFVKLKNPVLRRTVAKVANLAQAARIGNLELEAMIRELKRGAGQPVDEADTGASADAKPREGTDEPVWLDRDGVGVTVNADDLLGRGENPLSVVGRLAQSLSPGAVACVRSSFRPEPLIASLTQKGHSVFCAPAAPEGFETFVRARE